MFTSRRWVGRACEKRGRPRGRRGGRRASRTDPASAFQSFSARWSAESLRVLKPGGHLAAFAAPRTFHLLARGLEEAGFELRGQGLQCRLLGGGFLSGLLSVAHRESPLIQVHFEQARKGAFRWIELPRPSPTPSKALMSLARSRHRSQRNDLRSLADRARPVCEANQPTRKDAPCPDQSLRRCKPAPA
jgi:hypothetical protein